MFESNQTFFTKSFFCKTREKALYPDSHGYNAFYQYIASIFILSCLRCHVQ